jgi:hypothetical protein
MELNQMNNPIIAAMKITNSNLLDEACTALNKGSTKAKCTRRGNNAVYDDMRLAFLGDWLVEHQDGSHFIFHNDRDFSDHFKSTLA